MSKPLLERPEALALLNDADLHAGTVRECQERLTPFLQRYLPLFYRIEQREHARVVIEGKLSGLERKTSEPIARRAGWPGSWPHGPWFGRRGWWPGGQKPTGRPVRLAGGVAQTPA